jgi:hypothetical protein
MADIDWDDVVEGAPAPELAGRVPALAQTEILRYVNAEAFEPSVFGGEDSSTLQRARIYLAAHMATLGLRNGVSGPVVSLGGGKLTTTFATFALTNTYFATAYGLLLDQLIRTLAIVGFSV